MAVYLQLCCHVAVINFKFPRQCGLIPPPRNKVFPNIFHGQTPKWNSQNLTKSKRTSILYPCYTYVMYIFCTWQFGEKPKNLGGTVKATGGHFPFLKNTQSPFQANHLLTPEGGTFGNDQNPNQKGLRPKDTCMSILVNPKPKASPYPGEGSRSISPQKTSQSPHRMT